MKSSTTNVETSNVKIPSHEEEVFHESSESFQEESSSSSLDENIQQSLEEVGVPSSNIQSVSNNMVPNVDEASTLHHVFNERLKDAYFDTSTSFHDLSNVHTFYQPYPHEKKWTKDHPLHKIIGDLEVKSEALRDVDWASAMQDELDQFARLKKYGYSKDNFELNFKFLNNLQPEWKQYASMMRQNKNLIDINIDALYNILKQNQGDVNDVIGSKKKTVVVTSDPLALIAEKTKVSKSKEKVVVSSESEGSEADDFKWKQYATMMRQNKNLMDINIDSLYNILKKNQRDVNDAMGSKKKIVVVTSDPLDLIAEKTKVSKSKEKVIVSSNSEGSEADDFSELKKIIGLLAKAFNRIKFYSKPTNNNLRTSSTSQSATKKQEFVKNENKKVKNKDDEKKRDMSRVKCYNCKKEGHFAKDCKKVRVKDYDDSDQEINANMVFMTQIEKVLSDLEASSSSADEKISKVSYYLSESESESEFETSEYYDNSTNYGLFVNNDDDQEIFHDTIESASENFIENHIDSQKDYDKSNVLKEQLQVKHVVTDTHAECQEKYAKLEAERYEYMIRYFAYFDNDKQHRKQIANQEVLYDKMSVQLVELDKHVRDLKNTILEKDFKIFELEECVCNKDLEIEKCLEHLNICENKLHKMGQTNQTVHMIMPSNDNLYNGRKLIGFENLSYFKKAKDLRPTLYDEKVIGLGYTPMFLTHSDEALEIEKFKISRENKIEFAYDYGNLNASYVNERINFKDDYFQDIINPYFEKIDSPF
nr:nucleolar protein 58-like [Tanacetum cinerariifolium]